MNIEEYISSGKLELYVLDQLTAEEKAEVENIARTNPAIKKEIDLIERSLEFYANRFSKNPPAHIKQKVLSQIPNSVGSQDDKKSSFLDEQQLYVPGKKRFTNYLVAASWFLLIFFAGTTMYFWSMWRKAEQRLVIAQAEMAEYSSNYNNVKDQLEGKVSHLQNYIALLNDNFTESITLSGSKLASEARAKVFWNRRSSRVYIAQINLPPAPNGKQYQLWGLNKGKPVDLGVLSKVEVDVQRMKDISLVDSFAITLEKEGGSTNPTLDALYVIGEI